VLPATTQIHSKIIQPVFLEYFHKQPDAAYPASNAAIIATTSGINPVPESGELRHDAGNYEILPICTLVKIKNETEKD
jgi:hypothetical protein